jgi:Tfp pilus tip-associated adhesin PilY1
MNIIHCNPKTAADSKGFSLSAGSGFLRRTLPILMVLVVCFILASGWVIGVDKVCAETVDVWVSAENDDAEEDTSGAIDLTSSDLELIRESSDQTVGIRFQNITIEQGSTINSAYIEFSTDETGPTEATTLTFRGQAANNAMEFIQSDYNISSRATTTASVVWNIAEGDQWATAGEKHQTPDLASIIQEIVNRTGWIGGNSLVIIVTGSGKRTVESWKGAGNHGDATLAARLVIDYTDSGILHNDCEIDFRSNEQAQSDSTNSLSVAMPSGTQEGDLMIATVAYSNPASILSAPGDWTLIAPSSPGVEAMLTSAWYKVAGAGETGPYSFNATGSPAEMLVDVATFTSSAGIAVLAWHLKDDSYLYQDYLDTDIISDKVNCVDNSVIYLAGSYNGAGSVSNQPSDMTLLSAQMKTLVSLETYYQLRDAGTNIEKTITWQPSDAFLAAIAAVFRCQSTDEFNIEAIANLNGSISPSGSVTVPDGGSKTFAINPDVGYQIADVVVDGSSQGALSSYTFNNVKADHAIEAYFAASDLYVITTDPGSNGSISPAGPYAVEPGANQSFTIIADVGYVVDDVQVDGASVGALISYTFSNVNTHHSIAATFKVEEAAPPDDSCVDITDIPLDARYESAPPNILIAFDDSGSMSFEMLVPGAMDGRYLDYFDYVFDNPCGTEFGDPGCHEYDRDSILVRGQGRRHWKTQWAGFNKVYYDPAMEYEPWPLVTGRMDNADANNPRAHPMHPSPVFDLGSSYETVPAGSFEIIADDEDTAIFTKTGDFMELTDSEAYQGHYWAARNIGSYTATWTPYVPGGTYKVYARWRQLDDRWKDVPYTIVHAGGTDIVKVDQRSNGGSWVELGIYTFNSGIAKVSINGSLDKDNEKTFCADAIKFVPEGSFAIDIPRAHYYVKSAVNNKPYLVTVNNASIDYYEFYDANADDVVDAGELLPAVSPPSDVVTGRSYVQERQNFANYYTYYRRRGYTATYATAELITNMQAVRIGLFGINTGRWYSIMQPVLNIKNDGEDHTETLLNKLYEAQFKGGTPLRRALETAGRYFDKHDYKKLDGTGGDDSPWDSADNGGECQQAFTIAITDGYYNGANPRNGAITNIDGDNGVPYADDYSRTLADVAMYYYERDLNEDLADNVPVNPYDDATHQHMVTYTVGFGVVGQNSPDDYDSDLKHKTTGDYIVWPDPGKAGQTPEKIDDLWHASVNGRGAFLNSGNPRELVDALKAVMKNIERRVFSSSGVAINGNQLYQKLTSGLLLYQGSYSSEGWTGDVKAFKVDEDTAYVDILNPVWSASQMLDSKVQSYGWGTRLIVSYNGSSGIPFRFDSLVDTQKSQLDSDWATDDTYARKVMDYLHGDTSNEERNGGALRSRFSVLGDIVHSTPAFKNDMLYTGANDGMLHAFDAYTGEELFAYVPNLVFANLRYLAEIDYAHRYYVDLTPTLADVTLPGVSTMLVGGLGKGARGYFALDITDFTPTTVPSLESLLGNRVMWEYPDANTLATEVEDLGYSFSKAAVVQTNDPDKPWVVIFGNGYNSVNGHSVLFILDPATGDLLKRIDTGVGDCNGLSTPFASDVDHNGTVDYVYAGDLKGNLWKFDLSADDYTQWGVAYSDGVNPKPLFQTPGQPITTRPDVTWHCKKHGYLVAFGTGRWLGMADLEDPGTQAVYGIWDYGDDEDDGEYVGAFNGSIITDTNLPSTVLLLQQQVIESTENPELRSLSAGEPDWKTTTDEGAGCGDHTGGDDCDPNDIPSVDSHPDPVKNVGWFINLPSGERVVSDVQIRAGKLTFVSFVNEGSTCGLTGHSWFMAIDPCTGGRLNEVYFDISGDASFDSQDLINIGTPEDPIMVPPVGVKIRGKVEMPTYVIDKSVENIIIPGDDGTPIRIGGPGGGGGGDDGNLKGKKAFEGMTYWRMLR